MNITLPLFAVCSIIRPPALTAQELSGAPPATDSGTIAYVRIKANRAGIDTDTLDLTSLRVRNDSADWRSASLSELLGR